MKPCFYSCTVPVRTALAFTSSLRTLGLLLCAFAGTLPDTVLALAAAPSFSPLQLGDTSLAPSWTEDKQNYGWKVSGIWQETLCYAPNRTLILGAAHPQSHLAMVVTFKDNPPSLGNVFWAEEKRLLPNALSPAAFCFSARAEDIADKYGQLQEYMERTGRQIAEVRSCSLDILAGGSLCPRLSKTYGNCDGVRELLSRWWSHSIPYLSTGGWPTDMASRPSDAMLVNWIRKFNPRFAESLRKSSLGAFGSLIHYGGICGHIGIQLPPGFHPGTHSLAPY